ncbi:VTT domain-containing protein [bacterium]|nr:VTT domain-containing protein [bacterium]
MKLPKKGVLIVKIMLAIITLYLIHFTLKDYVTLKNIQAYQHVLHGYVNNQFIVASILFVLVFACATSVGLPLVVLLTLLGGFLFPFYWGLSLVLIAFFIHCVLMISVIRLLFKDSIEKHISQRFKNINRNIEKNGIVYVMFLRTSLVAPSFIVNCAAALTSINIWLFSIVSVICSIPILSILVYSGKLLGSIQSIWELYTTQNLVVLLGLAFASGIMVLIKTKKT